MNNNDEFKKIIDAETQKLYQKHEDALRIRYAEDRKFRILADRIHHSRMMNGAACMQCMKIAEVQLAEAKLPIEGGPFPEGAGETIR